MSIRHTIRRLLAGLHRSRSRTRTFRMHGGPNVRYGISLPASGASTGPRPLVLCLHHAWDQSRPVPRGIGRRLLEELFEPGLRDLHAIIVAPDCPGARWSDPVSGHAVLSLIEQIRERYAVAADRIVVAGLSDGATAAWLLLAQHPELFSAAVPVAGSPQLAWVDDRHAGPVYAIHSRADVVMPLAPTRAAIGMLRAHGVPAELVVLEDAAHMDIGRFVDPLRAAVPRLQELWTTGRFTAASARESSSEELG